LTKRSGTKKGNGKRGTGSSFFALKEGGKEKGQILNLPFLEYSIKEVNQEGGNRGGGKNFPYLLFLCNLKKKKKGLAIRPVRRGIGLKKKGEGASKKGEKALPFSPTFPQKEKKRKKKKKKNGQHFVVTSLHAGRRAHCSRRREEGERSRGEWLLFNSGGGKKKKGKEKIRCEDLKRRGQT